MDIHDHIVSYTPIIKRIGEHIILSEYETGKIKFANIVIDRSRKSVTEIFSELVDYLTKRKFRAEDLSSHISMMDKVQKCVKKVKFRRTIYGYCG